MSPTVNAFIVGSLTLGALYATVGLGFNVVFKSSGIANFAQGAFIVLGAFIYTDAARWAGGSQAAGVGIAMLITMLAGIACYFVVVRRMRGAAPWVLVILTFGLSTVLQTVASLIWGPGAILYVKLGATVHHFAGLSFTSLDVFAIVSAVVATAAMSLAMHYTRWGIATRAAADNVLLASQWGISVDAVSAAAWGITGALGALTGVVYAAQTSVSVGLQDIGLAAFPAIMLGGIDSIPGAVVGGIIVGGVVTGATIIGDPQIATLSGYVLLLIVLFVIPNGLFGWREGRTI